MKTATTDNTNAGHAASGGATKFAVRKILMAALCGSLLISPVLHAQNTHRAQLIRAQSQYFSAPNSPSLSITGDLTIEAWVKLSAAPGTNQNFFIANKYTSGASNQSFWLYYRNYGGTNQLGLNINESGNVWNDTPVNTTLNVGQWTHVAAVFTAGSKIELFVNGVSIGSTTAGIPSGIQDTPAPVELGARSFNGDYFNGAIDEVRLWAVARTQAQIKTTMFRELLGTETGLKGCWRLNNSLADTSGNGNTLAPMPTTNSGPTFQSNDLPFSSSAQQLEFCVDKDSKALWHLENATDSAGNGYGITNNNNVAFPSAKFANGADFGASNINKSLTRNVAPTANTYTVSMWVKLNTEISSGAYGLFWWNSPSAGTSIGIMYEYNGGTRRVRFRREGNSSFQNDSVLAVTMGISSWHHIALTYDGSFLIGYVDGIASPPVLSSVQSAAAWQSALSIGCATDANENTLSMFSSATIDEVAISSRAFTAEEIMKYYGGIVSARFTPTAAVDGVVHSGEHTTWAGSHDTPVGQVADYSGTTFGVYSMDGSTATYNPSIGRSFALFDTSALPDNASVMRGILSLYATGKSPVDSPTENDSINICAASPLLNTTLALEDFSRCGSVSNPAVFSTGVAESQIVTNGFNSWEFNSSGVISISKTSVSKFGIRTGHDIANTPIPDDQLGLRRRSISVTFQSADSSVNKPYLLVEYCAGSSLSISGNVSFAGVAIGAVVVSAGARSVSLNTPGAYSITGLPPGSTNLTAYFDANNDGVHQPWEPEASYAGNPITLNGDLTGLNLTLALPPDTDNDGMSDTWELANGLIVGVNDALLDKDGDGLLNIREYYLGTHPSLPDTDGDGAADGVEYNAGMNPLSADTDGDGLPDKWEMDNGLNPLANDAALDADGDGLTNAQEYNGGVNSTNPRSTDSNGNGVSDYEERNGVKLVAHTYDQLDRLIATQYANGAWEAWRYDGNGNILAHTLKTVRDADGDGLPDAWEASHGLAINDGTGAQGAGGDADGDGWTNYQEFLAGTDPTDASSHPPTGGVAGAVWFNPPKVRIVFPPSTGGGLAHVAMKLWDAETNPAQWALQWFDATVQQWKAATVTRVDGAVFTPGLALATAPGGTAHDLLWNALADLNGFNGTILLRATTQDAAGSTISEPAPFTVNTTGDFDGDGLPDWWEIAMNLDPNDATGINGTAADIDADGLTNFAEYAFGLNPRASDLTPACAVSAQTNPADGKPYLTLSYRRRLTAAALGLVYEIQTATALGTWTTNGTDIEAVSNTPTGDGATELVTVRIKPPLGTPGTPEKFGRVRVTHP